MDLTYHRTPYPENIIPGGDRSDYIIKANGVTVGFVVHDAAGRSSGTVDRWSAHVGGPPPYSITGHRTFRSLKAAVALRIVQETA